MIEPENATNAQRFAEDIEELVWDKDISYLEAILLWCETKGFDQTIAGDFVKKNPVICAKVQEEAEALNFLPKSTRLF